MTGAQIDTLKKAAFEWGEGNRGLRTYNVAERRRGFHRLAKLGLLWEDEYGFWRPTERGWDLLDEATSGA